MDPECPLCWYLRPAIEEFNCGKNPDRRVRTTFRLPPKRNITRIFESIFGNGKAFSGVIIFDDYYFDRRDTHSCPDWRELLASLEELDRR